MQEKEALIDIFDDDGNNIGHKLRQEINERIDILKQVNIVLINEDKIYIAKAKDGLWLGKWGTSAAGIVRHEESLADAAQRTLKRELGITVELEWQGENFYNFDGVKRLLSIFKGSTKAEPKPNSEEVEEGKWVTKEEAEQIIKQGEGMPTLAVALEVIA